MIQVSLWGQQNVKEYILCLIEGVFCQFLSITKAWLSLFQLQWYVGNSWNARYWRIACILILCFLECNYMLYVYLICIHARFGCSTLLILPCCLRHIVVGSGLRAIKYSNTCDVIFCDPPLRWRGLFKASSVWAIFILLGPWVCACSLSATRDAFVLCYMINY